MKRFVKNQEDGNSPAPARFRFNLAFILGIAGSVLVLAGSTLPQRTIPEHQGRPFLDLAALAALEPDGESMVAVFALFGIAFCLVSRYRWLILCALMIIVFAGAAGLYELADVLGLTARQIIDMNAGILPEGVNVRALLRKVQILEAVTYDTGLLVVAAGLLMMELAPWLRRFGWGARATDAIHQEPVLTEPTLTAEPEEFVAPPDMPIDGVYFFVESMQHPLSFTM